MVTQSPRGWVRGLAESYQTNFRADWIWRLLAAVLLGVLNDPIWLMLTGPAKI
jgi:hypothetical protein